MRYIFIPIFNFFNFLFSILLFILYKIIINLCGIFEYIWTFKSTIYKELRSELVVRKCHLSNRFESNYDTKIWKNYTNYRLWKKPIIILKEDFVKHATDIYYEIIGDEIEFVFTYASNKDKTYELRFLRYKEGHNSKGATNLEHYKTEKVDGDSLNIEDYLSENYRNISTF